jgi:LacI family transcriptional regulator
MPEIAVITSASPLSAVRMLQGLAAFARQQGNWRYHLVTENEPNWLGSIKWSKPDGIVARADTTEQADALTALGKPMVFYMSGVRGRKEPEILQDDYKVGRMAADHLLERGLRNIGYIGPKSFVSTERARGVSERLAERGLQCFTAGMNQSTLPAEDFWTSALHFSFLVESLRQVKPPAGILAFNDKLGVRIVDAARQMGLRVPEDLAVVGVDNNELLCDFAKVPLTSIDLDLYRFGFEAARVLGNLLAHLPTNREVMIIPPRALVARQSTDVLKFDVPDIAAAVRYIREHACDGIDVEEVLKHVSISRSALERRFQELLGHTPGDEIRRTRVQKACKLLMETDLKLIDIAVRCGFEYPSYFSRAFRREMGMTPNTFRAEHPAARKSYGGRLDEH